MTARAVLRYLALLLLALAFDARAGGDCSERHVDPLDVATAADSALRVVDALEREDRRVALIARVGTDLSQHGLVYSHAGFVLRDHADGRWSVLHLLNECGSDRSGIYVDGLVNFFADELLRQDVRIVWFDPAFETQLVQWIDSNGATRLHHPRYNLIARPGSDASQNSTAWVAEMLGAAVLTPAPVRDRTAAYRAVAVDGFTPDTIHVTYGKRLLGGLFSANTDFTDHSIGTRLSGDYPVVTVRAILRYLQRGHADLQREWRGGRWQDEPGPG